MSQPSKAIYGMIQTTEYVEDSGLVTAYGICCTKSGLEPEPCRVSRRKPQQGSMGQAMEQRMEQAAGQATEQATEQATDALRQDIVPNISTDPSFVERIIEALNRLEADPIHLRDLIEDFLP